MTVGDGKKLKVTGDRQTAGWGDQEVGSFLNRSAYGDDGAYVPDRVDCSE